MASGRITTTVTELPESRVRVEAEVAPDEIQRTVERAAGVRGRNLRMPGFRKGKVPPPLVIKRIGRDVVLKEAMREGLPRWYVAAVDESGIAPVGDPKLHVGKLQGEGTPLTFSFEIGVCPKATLGRYKGLEVGRREAEVDDEAVDAELEAVRERHARPQTVDRPAQRGDVLVIDFAGSIDGEPFEGGRGRDQMVELGSGVLVPGFEEQLEGASAGEERLVQVDFPEVDLPMDHRGEDLSGRRATFAVVVKEVKQKQLPELDDALALEAGGFDSLGDLREDIAARLREADERRAATEFRETVLDAAVAEASVELPDHLIEARTRELWERKLLSLGHQGISKEVYLQITGKTETEVLAESRPKATDQLRREAVVAAVIEAEGIEVSDDELHDTGEPGDRAPARDAGVQSPTVVASLRSRARPRPARSELARRRAIELMAEAAVPLTVEEAKARGKLWTPKMSDHDASEPWDLES